MSVAQEPGSARENAADSPSPVLFSVIIPVRNEEQNLARCLSSLQRLEFPRKRFEIVVDNGSTDGTRDVAMSFAECLPLHVLEKPQGYIAAVRNAGAALACGRHLAFLDADCEVLPDWLTQAARIVRGALTRVFGAFYIIPEHSSWIARHWYETRTRTSTERCGTCPRVICS